jgi:RNA polymerase sigma-70 factor (ECF subfamily)
MTTEPSLDSVQLQAYLDRVRAGDREAADALLRQVGARLERLAGTMLRGFPNVKRWADTDDVLQSALVRLLRSLRTVAPGTPRAFVNLVAVHVRRELLDLARHFRVVARRTGLTTGEGRADALAEVPDHGGGADDLDLWVGFHRAVERLPAEEREVVGLTFYHGWSQAQVAELFGVGARTVRRRWRSACLKLSAALGGRLPEP